MGLNFYNLIKAHLKSGLHFSLASVESGRWDSTSLDEFTDNVSWY